MVNFFNNPSQPNIDFTDMLESTLQSGRLTRRDYFQITSALLSNLPLSEPDRIQLIRILDQVQTLHIKIEE